MKAIQSPIFEMLIQHNLISLGETLHYKFRYEGDSTWYHGIGTVKPGGIMINSTILTPSLALISSLKSQFIPIDKSKNINGWFIWRTKNNLTLSELAAKISAIGMSIPSPISPVLKSYLNEDSDKKNLITIFGAGASYESGVPNRHELLDEILNCKDEKFIQSIAHQEFLNFYQKFFSSNKNILKHHSFERIFGFLDYFILNNKSLRGKYNSHYLGVIKGYLVRLILSIINTKVDTISEQLTFHNPYFKYVRAQLARDINPVLITLNYDTLLSSCFNCLYPFNVYLNYNLELANYKFSDEFDLSYNWINPNDVILAPTNFPPKRICVVKVHGSSNWKYCDNCESIYVSTWKNILKVDLRSLDSDKEYEKKIKDNPDFYCRECENRFKPLIMPPTHMKDFHNPVVRKLHFLFQHHIKYSENYIAIGYSFPDADIHIKSILSTRSNRFNKLCVVNPILDEVSRSIYKSTAQRYQEINLSFNELLEDTEQLNNILKELGPK